MRRRTFLGLLPFAAAAQNGMRDRYFTRYPFEKWAAAGDHTGIRWNARVLPAQLSAHQRLMSRIEIQIDAREVQKRRGRGEIITFFEIEDAAGRRWRRHDSFGLALIPPRAKAKPLVYVQDLFVVPGEYKVSLAACDNHNADYSFTQKPLRILPLRGDPLPEASTDLPDVELAARLGTPDAWFQPYLRGRLKLPLESSHAVRLDVILNLTLSERTAGSIGAFRRNMSVLVPALKVLSQIRPSNGSLDITLLDLTRRKTWEQKDVRELDWGRLRAPFAEASPGVIDAQSLAVKGQMTQFLWDQIRERLEEQSEAKHHVVIVLSSPVFLGHQTKVDPPALPKDPNRRVFYLRYRPLPRPPGTLPPPGFDGALIPPALSLPGDDIEHTLKALESRNFSALTPQDFRKDLAAMLEAIRTWIE